MWGGQNASKNFLFIREWAVFLSKSIVWMDSSEAHVFRFDARDVEKSRLKAHRPFRKIHHKAGAIGAGHEPLNASYFDDIAATLEGVHEWLLTGPGAAKEQMLSHVRRHHLPLEKSLYGVEDLDHPTDGQLIDHARRFFKAADRMHAR